jgi:hypothetical protein
MADIFISYAREDMRWMNNLVQALNSYGWSLWWDPEILPGKIFAETIEKELSSARCVVVGWSKQSIESRWVKEEALEADKQGKIIPVLVERVEAPFGFRSLHHIDLTAWDGTVNSPQLEELVKQLEKTLGPVPNPHVTQEEYQRTQAFFARLHAYDTGQISTITRLMRRDDEVVGGDVISFNHRASRFYGFSSESNSLSEISSGDLFSRLSSWVNPDDLAAFMEDQERLTDSLILGKECIASVPIRINSQHPYLEFRGQSFMPIIVAFSGKFAIDDHVEELIAVTYINVSSLCKGL